MWIPRGVAYIVAGLFGAVLISAAWHPRALLSGPCIAYANFWDEGYVLACEIDSNCGATILCSYKSNYDNGVWHHGCACEGGAGPQYPCSGRVLSHDGDPGVPGYDTECYPTECTPGDGSCQKNLIEELPPVPICSCQ